MIRQGYLRLQNILFCGGILLVTCITKIHFLLFPLVSLDSILYLNIGRNIFSGAGPYITYNFYQYWPDKQYPALVFTHPLYPLFAGLINHIFASLSVVILFNILLCGINGILIFIISRRLLSSRWVAFFIAITIVVTPPMQTCAVSVHVEQLYLCTLLGMFLVFLKKNIPDSSQFFTAGFLLGLGFLTRIASLNVVLFTGVAVLAGLRFRKSALMALIWLLTGFFSIILPYELFCYIKYRAWYPEQYVAFKYFLATVFGGYYIPGKPVLHSFYYPETILNGIFFQTVLHNAVLRFDMFIGCIIKYTGPLFLFVPVRLIQSFRERKIGELVLILVGVGNLFFYILIFFWDSHADFIRYSLVTFVTLIPVSVIGFYEFIQKLSWGKRGVYFKQVIFLVVVSLLFMRSSVSIIKYGKFYLSEAAAHKSEKQVEYEMVEWLNHKYSSDVLIATTEIDIIFPLKSLIVDLPGEKLLNPKNLKDYLLIYKPKVIWISAKYIDLYKPFIPHEYRSVVLPKHLRYYSVFSLTSQ